MSEIRFHLKGDEHGYLSNFFPLPHGLELDGLVWPTSEHYFQAQKFVDTDPEHAEAIRRMQRPYDAWQMGTDPNHPRRADWHSVRDAVMRKAVAAKFRQYPDLRRRLLATGTDQLVEHTATDDYWGDGGDGSGQNRLGQILMELRSELLSEAEEGDS
jgi:ribA/ribD-fused uncharacterized protein